MAQAQIYLREMENLMELVRVLYERVYNLDGSIHRFGGTLRQMQDQVPPNFRVTYHHNMDEDGTIMITMYVSFINL